MSSGTICLSCRKYEAQCNCEIQILSDNGKSPNDAEPCDHYPNHCDKCALCWCDPKIEIVNGSKIFIHNEVQ